MSRTAAHWTAAHQRLCRTLEGRGPVFALFGRYLASRGDLLPARTCLALDEIPDRSEPAPAVVERLASELRRPLEDVFASFDETPVEVGLLDQTHHAELTDGRPVVVRLAHPDLGELIEHDVEALALLRPAFAESPMPGFPLDEAIADFRRHLAARRDLAVQAAALESLAGDVSESLTVPEVFPALTTPKLMTIELLPSSNRLEATATENRHDLARNVFLIWLEQALVAGTFPVEADLLELRDGRLAITGGVFARLPASSRRNLWEYLRHAAAHRPVEACDHLLREVRGRKDARESDLRLRMRQAVPFRDGHWSERGDTMAEHLVLHWSLTRECGFEPASHLQTFCRGLFWAARLSWRLTPRTDPLREAHEDLRWLTGWRRIRRITEPRELIDSLESGAARMLEIPEKLDRLLDAGLQVEKSAPARRRENRTAAAVALALTMAALALLATRLTEFGLPLEWVERVGAALFMALGALLLRTIMKQ